MKLGRKFRDSDICSWKKIVGHVIMDRRSMNFLDLDARTFKVRGLSAFIISRETFILPAMPNKAAHWRKVVLTPQEVKELIASKLYVDISDLQEVVCSITETILAPRTP